MEQEIKKTGDCFEEKEMKDIQNRVATISSGHVQLRASPVHTIRFLFTKYLDEMGQQQQYTVVELTIDELHEILRPHSTLCN